MSLKKGDFITIDYTAKDKESNKVFDTTEEQEAKKNNIYNAKIKYKSVTICLGENQILQGIDDFLIDKDQDKEYEIEIPPEKGFGKKDPHLFKIMPAKEFKKQNIAPFPGLHVRFDELQGTIRSVSGGRIIVDFNHILAGHTLVYKIKTHKLVKEDDKKIESLLVHLDKKAKVTIKDKEAEISSSLPEPLQKYFEDKIKQLIPSIKEVKFKTPDKQ